MAHHRADNLKSTLRNPGGAWLKSRSSKDGSVQWLVHSLLVVLNLFRLYLWLPRGAGSTLDPKSGSDLETDDSTLVTRENGKHDSQNETFWEGAGQASRQASN